MNELSTVGPIPAMLGTCLLSGPGVKTGC